MQEPLAEGVDRLYFESARRLDRACKQPPRESELLLVDTILADVLDRSAELRVPHRRPFSKHAENTRSHVCRRRLGIGKAKDAAWRDAFEQQPHDALRQHMRLARAGIRRDPNRCVRVGGLTLTLAGQLRNLAFGGGEHQTTSSPARPPVADHSFTRARWS